MCSLEVLSRLFDYGLDPNYANSTIDRLMELVIAKKKRAAEGSEQAH